MWMFILLQLQMPNAPETIEPHLAAEYPKVYCDAIGPIQASDLKRFNIPYSEVYDNWQFSENHLKWIESRWWDTAGWERIYESWYGQAHRFAWAWYYLYQASSPNATDEYVIDHLKLLRARIGVDAYYSGEMPPPAPFWYFTRK